MRKTLAISMMLAAALGLAAKMPPRTLSKLRKIWLQHRIK